MAQLLSLVFKSDDAEDVQFRALSGISGIQTPLINVFTKMLVITALANRLNAQDQKVYDQYLYDYKNCNILSFCFTYPAKPHRVTPPNISEHMKQMQQLLDLWNDDHESVTDCVRMSVTSECGFAVLDLRYKQAKQR